MQHFSLIFDFQVASANFTRQKFNSDSEGTKARGDY